MSKLTFEDVFVREMILARAVAYANEGLPPRIHWSKVHGCFVSFPCRAKCTAPRITTAIAEGKYELEPSSPTTEPSPCPWCGSKMAIMTGGPPEENYAYQVWCQSCGTRGPELCTEEGAVEAWNTMPREETT
jgi:hypothetical protein